MTLKERIIELGHSAEMAERYIRAGQVKINDDIVFIPSEKLKTTDKVFLKESKKWVSRGAYKLLAAIDQFDLILKDKVVLDIGSSTGGFSQVALENGAKHVFSLDVGTNQLDFKIRRDPRVTSIEKTNLKLIDQDMFDREIDVVVTDVSFISLRHVFNVVSKLTTRTIMALIKPQFEANSNQVLKGGVVPKELHKEIIEKVKGYAEENNFTLEEIAESPITGKQSKNIEYITIFRR